MTFYLREYLGFKIRLREEEPANLQTNSCFLAPRFFDRKVIFNAISQITDFNPGCKWSCINDVVSIYVSGRAVGCSTM